MRLASGMIAGGIAVTMLLAGTEATARGKGKGSREPSTGVATNYGCKTLAEGTVLTTSSGTTTRLEAATYTCFLCDPATGVCKVQTPTSLAGASFKP